MGRLGLNLRVGHPVFANPAAWCHDPATNGLPTPLRRGQLWGNCKTSSFKCHAISIVCDDYSVVASHLESKRMTQLPGKVGVRILDHFVLIAVAQLAMQIRVARLFR
jgi:hypothetical protein